jgi:hypothetical protein
MLRRACEQPTDGIVGLVDDLLRLCGEWGSELDWDAGRCRVRRQGGDWEELPDVRLRRSVFRAILARVAVLCNQQHPESVSPYGGEAELVVSAQTAPSFHVTFVNTADEQSLQLRRATENEQALPDASRLE